MKHVVYENHIGEQLNLSGDGIHSDSGGLSDWEVEVLELNGRAAGFSRKRKSLSIAAVVTSPTPKAGLILRDRIYEITAKDTDAGVPGKLIIDGWYVKGYVTGSTKDAYWLTGCAAKYELQISVDNPVWTREHALSFWPASSGGADAGSYYPHDYPHDYRASSTRKTISNPGFQSAPLKITIYGPCDNPRVMLGGSVYEVEAPLEAGDLLVIDGLEKTIRRIRRNGFVENVFSRRIGNQKIGSGSFIFQPISPGSHDVSWDGSFGFDVVVYEQRAERRWS